MFRSLLIVLITLLPQVSFAGSDTPHDRFACGVSQIEVFNSNDVKQPYFTIKISNTNHSIKLRYSVRNEFLFARCDTNSQNSPLLLIQHYCGGSGCAHAFGIIEPKSLQVLLAPSQGMEGNLSEATKVMGHEIKAFSCKTYSKTSQGGQGNGEYCYVSPIELG
ncbi:MAG: hypothetical protein ACAH07_06180 [Methylophilaceae bacterium]|nr:hypothetical protein [Methyloradius sp.]